MTRRKVHTPLNVFLNGRHVGVLRRQTNGAIDFQYQLEWLAWEHNLPVSLSLPLREDRYIGAPVVNFFENLLPDSESIRRRIAQRVHADGIDAYSMLAALGHDCVGALQFLADGEDPGIAGDTAGKALSDDDIAELIRNLPATPLGLDDDADFRISIAGMQEKTALLRRDGCWFKPVGTTATTHILKPRIGTLPNGIDLRDSVENEYLCLKLMAALGVPTASAEMADFGGRRILIVERFDRLWTADGRLLRLPQEDCCQALSVPPTRKYQSDGGPAMHDVIGLLKGGDSPEADIALFMRTNMVFWLLGATDGHAKNFSVFITPGSRYRLTPAYDVLTAQPSLDAGQIPRKQLRLAMSVGKNRHYAVDEIVPRHFRQTGELAGVGGGAIDAIISELGETASRIMTAVVEALPAGFPERLVDSVMAAINDRSRLLREFDRQ